jgi:hypothetical protein
MMTLRRLARGLTFLLRLDMALGIVMTAALLIFVATR